MLLSRRSVTIGSLPDINSAARTPGVSETVAWPALRLASQGIRSPFWAMLGRGDLDARARNTSGTLLQHAVDLFNAHDGLVERRLRRGDSDYQRDRFEYRSRARPLLLCFKALLTHKHSRLETISFMRAPRQAECLHDRVAKALLDRDAFDIHNIDSVNRAK